MSRNMFAAVAVLALIVASLALPTLFSPSSATGFAQVREQLDGVRTIIFDAKLEVEEVRTETLRVMICNDGRIREEYSDGKYEVSERTEDAWTRMDVDPAKKTAHMTYGFPQDVPLDMFSWLRDLPKSAGASPIDARTINGRSCPGFLINLEVDKASTQQMRLWIDPETRLPIYYVVVAERKPSSGAATKDPDDSNRCTATCSNFKYNIELEDSLFSLTPPEGYAVTAHGTPPTRRSEPWPTERLLLTVGEGIGPVEFGMSREQVLELLGEPEEKKEPRQHVREGAPPWETESWYYNSQGFAIIFSSLSEPGGLHTITCRPANFVSRGFQGRTKEGIGLGSSPEDVRRAYGDPPQEQPFKGGLGAYRYYDKGLSVGFVDGVVYQLQIFRPRKKPTANGQREE
jgi:outer membrane lipoprotein-sorting protein